ncbi:hypothetical protein [Streptomyces wuyuanensis]|uniref:hypothetical protein n=1 Tax=Streptomyces wuyuanensis TaxID=1196353 RepID=UPI003D742A4A
MTGLLTSVPADQADAGQALIHYKGQGAVERRYHDFNGRSRSRRSSSSTTGALPP